MAKFAKAKTQAAKAVSRKLGLGKARHGNHDDGRIHSVRTAQHYERHLANVARWLADTRAGHGLPKLTAEEGVRFLVDQAAVMSQSSLDQLRQAIECHLGVSLGRIKSERETIRKTRSYYPEQVKAVMEAQSVRNSLSTAIAREAGLRAHELLTIHRIDEQKPSGHRTWLPDLFKGKEDCARYTVIGKGGLIREVRLPSDLTARLETRRLNQPKIVRDRGVIYESHYDIGGGNAWSKSFSVAARKELGFSNGAHGLRHSYAQSRMEDYQSMGHSYVDALACVANELGHFSPHTTEVYLR